MISTIGIHEVRGYARLFASIGLKPELTTIFDSPAYMGSKDGGTGFAELDADGDERQRVLAGEDESKPAKTFRFYPKVYKAAVAAANGTGRVLRVLAEGARPRARAADLAAPHPRPEVRPRGRSRRTRWTRAWACTATRS